MKTLENISTHFCDVAKTINEDERLFTAVVLRPNVVDAHGDIYDEDVVKQACYDYVSYCMNTNLQHTIDLEKSDMRVVESYISPVDYEVENNTFKRGDWIMTAKIENEELWKSCKDGTFTGFSVGCSSYVEVLEDES